MDELNLLNQLKQIVFIGQDIEKKEIRSENKHNLEFFINSLFKNKYIQFDKINLDKFFSILPYVFIKDLCNKKPNNISFRKMGYFYEKLT